MRGLPLTKEARIFFLDGQPLVALEYWPDGGYGDARPPLDEFTAIAGTIPSRFFTMDVALRTNGECDHRRAGRRPGLRPA